MNSPTITFRLSEEMRDRILRHARDRRITRTEVILTAGSWYFGEELRSELSESEP